jgi:pimeloyl-ACP methyl ester carboxylesterase
LREPAVPSSLPPVVLIHGFSMGCRIWKPIADALAQEGGRRVLTFDLFGRGYSDAAYPCDLSLFTGQLTELLFSLEPILGPGPYDILGTSMGGAIAINFANLYPHQVRQFVLLSPAGLPVHVPFTARLAKLPLIGDIFMPILGPVSLKTHARKGHAYPDDPALKPIFDAMGKVLMRQTSVNPGFFPALLSTLRNFPLNDMEDGYRKLGETRPENGILVIWGDLDEVTPFYHSETVMKLLGPGKARLLVLDDCGHVDALEVPKNIAQMMPPLIEFLEGK